MATFLDISILSHFVSVFTFLLVFVIIFGLLEVFKVFGEGRKGLHALIAACIGFIFIFSSGVTTVIQTFMPWFTILILVIFFILFAVRMFGVSQKDISSAITEGSVMTWILIFTVLILLFSLGAGFGQKSLQDVQTSTPANASAGTSVSVINNQTTVVGSTNSPNFNQNLYNTLYNPKVLGLVLIMIIVILAMLFLTAKDD